MIDTRAQRRQEQVEAHPFFGRRWAKKEFTRSSLPRAGWVRGIRTRLGASQRNEIEMINGHLRLANVDFGVGLWGSGAWHFGLNMFVGLFVCLSIYS